MCKSFAWETHFWRIFWRGDALVLARTRVFRAPYPWLHARVLESKTFHGTRRAIGGPPE